MNEQIQVMLTGRLVCGHPMNRGPVIDKVTKQQVIRDGVPVTNAYIGLAIPKNGSTDWKQTDWGQQFYAKGVQDWPRGEYGANDFAWKVTDGDSPVPNKKGKIPNQREGWPGHWIVHCSTQLLVRCHHLGKYDPIEQIQDKNEIKTGDFCRVLVGVQGNGPSESPGLYVNPILFELSRAGEQIITESGPSAAEVFGGVQPVQQPVTPPVQPTVTNFGAGTPPHSAAPMPPVPPTPPAQTGPQMAPNCPHTYEALKGAGWTDEQMRASGFLL